MNTYRTIDKKTWPRGELFDFYQKFANPCFNVSVSLEADNLYACSRDRNESFFLLALYAILRAANAVPQLRQRILNDGAIVQFDRIAVMTPVMTDQEIFRQIWCEYAPEFGAFSGDAAVKVEAAKKDAPSPMEEHGEDYFCASCLPWLHFTAISQADFFFGQPAPILAWGKMKNGLIPVSCKFSHSFVDGLHASRFFGSIEDSFANPDSLWEAKTYA